MLMFHRKIDKIFKNTVFGVVADILALEYNDNGANHDYIYHKYTTGAHRNATQCKTLTIILGIIKSLASIHPQQQRCLIH